MSTPAPMRIGYLVNQYPGISHSFIRREIEALERRGCTALRYSIRAARDEIIAPEDKAERAKTRIILNRGGPALILDAMRLGVLRPGPAMSALAVALRLARRSETGLARHFIYWIEAATLAAWLRADGAQHLHAHFGTNSATVALLAARMSGLSFSFTVHGPEEFDKQGPIHLADKIKAATFVAAVSDFGVSQLRRLCPPDDWSKIIRVRCGVEPAFYANREPTHGASDRFVCVARLSAQKGLSTLLEAAAILKRRDAPFSIRIIGDGELREMLAASARRLNVADCVEFAGWKTPAEIAGELETARAFVLPSYAEGLPVSIMEAFFLEKPVISTSVAGIPELVVHGENGWLAPASNAEALADAMSAALNASADQLRAMGAAGKRRALARHDIDREAARLAEAFSAAIAQRRL